MILILSVAAGLLAGVIRARILKTTLQVPKLKGLWLFAIAAISQIVIFSIPVIREYFPVVLVKIGLLTALICLLAFSIININLPGFWLITLGVFCNLLVISTNGGLMPISPASVQRLLSGKIAGDWSIGARFGFGKDIVLSITETKFWFLSDCLLLPKWSPYQVAFSIGDVFLAAGVFWLLFSWPVFSKGGKKWYSIFQKHQFKLRVFKEIVERKSAKS